ncbi:SDR family NAD(P)-dependent oxidoreductase [Streptomyces sp. NPDC048172]|uniref:SDR family NAD(P)-dependent oxidoreductase n=1 Tax=Streptomyces sp. NPDC048172 TaxID=3365505 RepID=UPI003717C42C
MTRAVLVTGCSRGLGEAVCRRLARLPGLTVYATARDTEQLASLREAGCVTMRLDVTDDAQRRAVVRRIEECHGQVDILVNNAGIGRFGPVEAVDGTDLFSTNVFAATALIQLVLPGMRRAGSGRIVNVSSVSGRITYPGGGWYTASKHALEALSDTLRTEVSAHGISVTLVECAWFASEFFAHSSHESAAPYQEMMKTFHRKIASRNDWAVSSIEQGATAVCKAALGRSRPRHVLGNYTRLMIHTRRILGARAWDAVMRVYFQQPSLTSALGMKWKEPDRSQ